MLTKVWYFALFSALVLTGIAWPIFAQVPPHNEITAEQAKNIAKALPTLKDMAGNGNVEAQYTLGKAYLQGQGVPQSYTDARKLFEKASMGGNHGGAQYTLGWMYETGQGVTKSCMQALEWYWLAAAQNYKDAGEKADSLQSRLSDATCQQDSTKTIPAAKAKRTQHNPALTLPTDALTQATYEQYMQCVGKFDGGYVMVQHLIPSVTPKFKQALTANLNNAKSLHPIFLELRQNLPIMAPHLDAVKGQAAYNAAKRQFDANAFASLQDQAKYYYGHSDITPNCLQVAQKLIGLQSVWKQAQDSLKK